MIATISALTISAKLILKPFSVRIHAKIARNPFARIWYLMRALDFQGRGYGELAVDYCCEILNISTKTLYRWLKDGKQVGAFRRYSLKKGIVKAWLGSLHKVSHALNLENWGAVGAMPLGTANAFLRSAATVISSQQLQEASHYAARTNLKSQAKPLYIPPRPEEIFATKQSSLKLASGKLPFVLHVGQKRIFVSKSFVPFGASQESIGKNLGICPLTVQRHQQILNLERRQIMQAKSEYAKFVKAIDFRASYFEDEASHSLLREIGNDYFLSECNPNAKKGKIDKKGREGTTPTFEKKITVGTFCRYLGKTWIHRCNLYQPMFDLASMRASRKLYKKQREKPPEEAQVTTPNKYGSTSHLKYISDDDYDRWMMGSKSKRKKN